MTLKAVQGREVSDILAALDELKAQISVMGEKELAVMAQKFSRAEERFRLLK
jgi:hypothetical protein